MTETLHDTPQSLDGAPVPSQPARKNVPVEDAWLARLSPAQRAVISTKAVTLIRGQQAWHLSANEAAKLVQALEDWQGRERE